jgi:regulator of replication initiation timing
VCKQIYDLEEYIERLDAEVSAKLQDLKEHVTDVKKIQLEKEKEL